MLHAAPETVTGHGASYISGVARVQDQLIVLLEVEELLDRRLNTESSGMNSAKGFLKSLVTSDLGKADAKSTCKCRNSAWPCIFDCRPR